MAKFVYIYTGGSGMSADEETRAKEMEQWQTFLGGFGDKLVDIGAPFGASQSAGNGTTTKATGYSVVSAGSLEDAVKRAKACPIFEKGGNVEVYEALEM